MLDYDTAHQLRLHLVELPDLLTAAEHDLHPSGTPTGDRVSGATRTPPLPLRLDVLELITAAEQLLASWARAMRDELRTANHWDGWRVARRRGETAPTAHLRYLLHSHEFAATRPFASDYAAEIGQTHRTLTRATGLLRRPARVVCPRCQLLTMQDRPDGARECANPDCWAVLHSHEYADRAEQYLAELHAA